VYAKIIVKVSLQENKLPGLLLAVKIAD